MFRMSVQRVTTALWKRLDLPSFREWLGAYRADPDRYEADLIGLWKHTDDHKLTGDPSEDPGDRKSA